MSQPDFEIFTRPDNKAGRVLQAYIVTVQSLMDDITIHEQNGRVKAKRENQPVTSTMRWMKTLLRDIDPSMREYYRWPILQTHRVWMAQGTAMWARQLENSLEEGSGNTALSITNEQ